MYTLLDILSPITQPFSSKKTKCVNKRFDLLQKHQEFSSIQYKYGRMIKYASKVKNFLYEQPVEEILKDEKSKKKFFKKLEQLCAAI